MKKIFVSILITIMIFCGYGATVRAATSAQAMVTEWTIPANNTQIKLPISGTGMNYTVDWGDGNTSSNLTSTFPTHTYTNAGKYEIKISGTIANWGDVSDYAPTLENSYYTYTNYLTSVKQFGDVSALRYSFAHCTNLKEVSGENLVTDETFAGITSMYRMFYKCFNLKTIDASNFKIENVTDMRSMFEYCSGLEVLDLSGFATSQVLQMSNMFKDCSKLRCIQFGSEFELPADSVNNMFLNLPNASAIIMASTTPLASQFTSVKNQMDEIAIYVPNDLETTYETAWSGDFSGEKIEPILKSTNTDFKINIGHTYTDTTYITVAGFDESYNQYYKAYGYNLSKSGVVDTQTKGTYVRTYKLTRTYEKNGVTTTEDIAQTTRNIIVDYSNYSLNGIYYDTFQDAINAISGVSGEIIIERDNIDNIDALVPTGKTVTINTNGKTMRKQSGNINIKSGAALNIIGEGTIIGECETGEYVIFNSGTLNIIEGKIIGKINAIFDESNGNLSIGTNDETISTEAPEIIAEGYSINSIHGFNFYDGVLKAKNTAIYSENIEVPEGYSLYISNSTVSGEKYESTTLIEIEKTSKNMVTEWTIPADNTQIKLPAKSIDALVDWGDGYAETVKSNLATHTYKKAGTYDITVIGTCYYWGEHFGVSSSSNVLEDYETYVEYLTGLKQWGELQAKRYSFNRCANLKYVSGDATENTFKNISGDMSYAFYMCTSLKNVDLTNCNISEIEDIAGMFANCTSLEKVDFGDNDIQDAKEINNMFYNCLLLKELDLSKFNTSNVENMEQLFYYCKSLESINLQNFNTSNVTNMSSMFNNCIKLKTLDLSNFNTSKVNNMSALVFGCVELENINFGNINTSNVTNMSKMFTWCYKLKNIDLSSFNTSKVKDMSQMFRACYVLENIDIRNFDTSKVVNMNQMFEECHKIVNLDLSNMSTTCVLNMSAMFYNCYKLKSILISSDFVVSGDTICRESGNVNKDIFDKTSLLTAIINISETPVSNQFKGKLPTTANLYVPNGTDNLYKEYLSGDTTSTKIKPLLNLIGNEKISVDVGSGTYQDAGYTVAGFTKDNQSNYTCYGYTTVSRSGEVNTEIKGKYYVTYEIKRNYNKNNQSLVAGPYSVTREITVLPVVLQIPTVVGTYTYNGSNQTLELQNFEQDKMEITGNVQRNANKYTATVSIKNKNVYEWSDGTSSDKNINWEIKPIIVEIKWNGTTYEYTGNKIENLAEITNALPGENVTVTAYEGTTDAVEVGTYTAKIKSLSSTNYTLEGTINVEKQWKISLSVVQMNVIMKDFYYGGLIANPEITNNEINRPIIYYYNLVDSNTGGVNWNEIKNTTTLPVGTYYMYAKAEEFGNYAEVITDPVQFKILGTKLELTTHKENGEIYNKEWINSNLYVDITIDGKANITAYQYKIGETWESNIPKTIALENSMNGELLVRGINPAGKVVTNEVSTGIIKIDKEAPNVSNVSYKNENKELIITATLNDSLSGVTKYAIISENGIENWLVGADGTKTLSVSGSGVYYIAAKDLAGNIAMEEINVVKDITPPKGSVTVKEAYTIEDNIYYTNQMSITILVNAKDNISTDEQIKMAIYKESEYTALNSEEDITWETYSQNKEWELERENADEKIYLILKDLAGNVSISFSN